MPLQDSTSKLRNGFLFLLLIASVSFAVDVTNCQVINSAGSYVLLNNLAGAPTPTTLSTYTQGCIVVTANDVDLDCNGNTVSAGGVGGNTVGILSHTSDNVTVRNCNVTGYNASIYVHEGADNTIIDNEVSDANSQGIYVRNQATMKTGNQIINNTVTNNAVTGQGIYILYAPFSLVEGNVMSSTTNSGRFSASNSPNSIVRFNEINVGGGSYGIFESSSNNITYLGNDITAGWGAYSSSATCSWEDNNFTGNPQFSAAGMRVGNNCIINNNRFTGFTRGIWFAGQNSTAVNSTLFGNQIGAVMQFPHNTLDGGDVHGNDVGILFQQLGADSEAKDVHLYDNVVDIEADSTGSGAGNTIDYVLSNVIIDNPAGNFENYTNLSAVDDLNDNTETYTITWTSQTAPTDYNNFHDMYVNVNQLAGSSSIDSLVWSWTDAQASGFNENNLRVLEFDGTWADTGAALDTGANTLSLSSVSSFSDFGVLESNITNCMVINSPGTYSMANDFVGAPNLVTGTEFACVLINSSDVVFDCNGFSITGDGTQGTIQNGIYTNGQFGSGLSNITISNCNVSGYSVAINVRYSNDSVVTNSSAYDNTDRGIQFWGSNRATITDNTAHSNNVGIHTGETTDTGTISGNTVYNNSNRGIEVVNAASNYTVSGNVAYNNSVGIHLGSSSTSHTVTDNVAFNNSQAGFDMRNSATGYTISNLTAYNNADGFIFSSGAANHNITDVTSYNNSNDGFHLEFGASDNQINGLTTYDNGGDGVEITSSSNNNNLANVLSHDNGNSGTRFSTSTNNSLLNSAVYNNVIGVHVGESSNQGQISGNEVYNNTNRGIEIQNGANGVTVSGNDVHGNSVGIDFDSGTTNHAVTDNVVHDNAFRGFDLSSGATGINMTDNTAYNNVDGFSIAFGSNGAVLINNTAHDNSLSGFRLTNVAVITMEDTVSHGNGQGILLSDANSFLSQGGHLYDNAADINVTSVFSNSSIVFTNVIIDNPAGDFTNFTNLSIVDTVQPSENYLVAWDPEPATPPHPSFEGKYVEITPSTPVSIDTLVWGWTDAESASYDENAFQLWKYNGTWSMEPAVLNTASNTLTLTNVADFSTFGILESNNCPVITSPGTYLQSMAYTGAPHNVTSTVNPASSVDYSACVVINADDVTYDCNGFQIANDGTPLAMGVLINNTNNVTLQNCQIPSYNYSAYTFLSNDTTIDNVIAGGSAVGYRVENSTNVDIRNGITSSGPAARGTDILYSDHVLIDNVRTFAGPNSFGAQVYYSNDVTYNNSQANGVLYGFYGTNSNNSVINNLTVQTSPSDESFGVYAYSAENVTVTNSIFNPVGNGVYTEGFGLQSHVLVEGNTISAGHFGTEITQTYNATIRNNNITMVAAYQPSPSEFGFFGVNLDHSLIEGNRFIGAGRGAYAMQFTTNVPAPVVINNYANNFNQPLYYSGDEPGAYTANNVFENGEYGIYYAGTSDNSVDINNTISNMSANGHYILNVENITVENLTVFDSHFAVISSSGNDLSYINPHLYNNSYDFVGGSSNFTATNAIFDNPMGSFENFTNLSITDDASSEGYYLNWSSQPAALPADRVSFQNKWIDIGNFTPTMTIDTVIWHWTDAESSGLLEDNLELQLYNGTFSLLNDAPDTVANTLTETGVAQNGTYGILYLNDTIAPTVTLISPANGSSLNDSNVTLVYDATDDIDTSLDCEILLDGSPSSNNTIVSDGLHMWNVSCTDDANNTGTSETWEFTVDTTAPVITLVFPANGSTVDSNDVDFIYNVDELNAYTCDVYVDDVLETDPATLGEGTYDWYVQCTDAVGNTGTSETWTFTIDIDNDEEPPVVTLIYPPDGATLNTTAVTLQYSVTDDFDDVLECTLTHEGTEYNASVANGDTESVPVTAVEGLNSWSVTCTDDADRSDSESRTFTVELDHEAPVVTLVSPANDSIVTTPTVNLEYNVTDNVDPSPVCTIYLDDTETASPATVTAGAHEWYVACEDTSGNIGLSETWTFTVDLEAPVVTLISPANGSVLNTNNVDFVYDVVDDSDPSPACTVFLNNVATPDPAMLPDGPYEWYVSCLDHANRTGTSETWTFTIDTSQPADDDNDGVPNGVDLCEDTVIPESVPYQSLNPNHYAMTDSDEYFETNDRSSKHPHIVTSDITINDTYGCTCEQILECKPGSNKGELKFGCTEGTLNVWMSQTAWAAECQPPDQDAAFQIDHGKIIPYACYSADVEVLGTLITYGGTYDVPVTMKVRVGGENFEPYGPFSLPVDGNINNDTVPEDFITGAQSAGEPISFTGRSWLKKKSYYSGNSNSHWQSYLTVNSLFSDNVIILKDGDNVPQVSGFLDQQSVAEFMTEYVDSGKIKLEDNQAIVLFELGTTNPLSSAADFQDAVLLVTVNEDECPN
jgi:parallel beta-helix repeat protein